MEFLCSICVTFFQERIPGAKTSPACILHKTHTYSSKNKTQKHMCIHMYIYWFINKFIIKYLHQYFNYKKALLHVSDSDRSHPQESTIFKHISRVLVWLFTTPYDRPRCIRNVTISDFPLHLNSKKFNSLRMLGYRISNFNILLTLQ